MALLTFSGPINLILPNVTSVTFTGESHVTLSTPAELIDRLGQLETNVSTLREQFMTTKADFIAAIQRVDAETTRIADLVQAKLAELATRMPDADAQEVLALINAEVDKLRPIGADVENPVPGPSPVAEAGTAPV